MIQLVVDPRANGFLNVGKIDEHASIVESLSFKHDNRFAVVSMKMPALPRVIQESVAVTEFDVLRHSEHCTTRCLTWTNWTR